ncbi:MAG: hypothetical protein A4E19_04875 [Nitrospira sp. SG-bin1]|nr:MAG: hypothetical protein A4E19_04875 [Nitrospira sp. SG-bin1]
MLMSFTSIERLADTSQPGHPRLEQHAVHLWGLELHGTSQSLERCAGWLDEGERHRAARLVREEHRRHYVLAHGGLRAVLGKYLGVPPDKIVLDHSATGKPFLAGNLRDRSAITFNLSHAHGRALIAVSKGQEIGVDLELVRSDVDVTKLSERFFARSEHTAIEESPPERRARIFFRYWVAKEALLKAQGIGLQGLSHCEILLEADGVDGDVRVRLGSLFPDTLSVLLLPCEPGWEAAVAARRLESVTQCDFEQRSPP